MMNKNEFAAYLLSHIKDGLRFLGIKNDVLNQLDDTIFLIVIIAVAFIASFLFHLFVLRFINKLLKYRKSTFLKSMLDNNALKKLSNLIPPLIISALLPFAFDYSSVFYIICEKITWIYFLLFLIFSVKATGKSAIDAMMNREDWQNRPIKGFVEIIDVIIIFIISIIIISIIINKTPLNLITGLGAFAAILMLIFKDTIVGFVSGVLVSENDMVHIGDWIEVPGTVVNGTVKDISLTTVKIVNFDNSVVTVPPETLISSPLINWRAMQDSGGRRIMRSYNIKLDYIKPCTSDFLDKMKAFDADLSAYIDKKQKQQQDGKEINTDNPQGLVNGTIDTNVGLLRAYMTLYISKHPSINKDMLFMVRALDPTENGLPIQIYCFSSNTNWASYESIQSEIMEHFVSVLPAFELYPFQNAGSREYILSGLMESNKVDINNIIGMPWSSLKKDNP